MRGEGRLPDLLQRDGKLGRTVVNLRGILAPQHSAQLPNLVLDFITQFLHDTVARIVQRFLGRVDQRVGAIALTNQLAAAFILLGVQLGVLNHLGDLIVAQARRGRDRDMLLLAGGLVLRGHVDDAIGVDVECHFDLWDAARGRRDAVQHELAE